MADLFAGTFQGWKNCFLPRWFSIGFLVSALLCSFSFFLHHLYFSFFYFLILVFLYSTDLFCYSLFFSFFFFRKCSTCILKMFSLYLFKKVQRTLEKVQCIRKLFIILQFFVRCVYLKKHSSYIKKIHRLLNSCSVCIFEKHSLYIEKWSIVY